MGICRRSQIAVMEDTSSLPTIDERKWEISETHFCRSAGRGQGVQVDVRQVESAMVAPEGDVGRAQC